MVEEIKDWVIGTLIGANGYFAPVGFPATESLYRTPIRSSFVQSVIDGASCPAAFSVSSGESAYRALVRGVQRVSLDEPACWFYVTDPDDALSLLSWVHRCDYDQLPDYWLASFEREPADQNGCSWLGLVGGSRQWLLLHERKPFQEHFGISVHGSDEFCRAVAELVGR